MTAIWEIDDGEEEIAGLDENGRPDPAYAARLGLVRAPFPRRAGAAVIDAIAFLVTQVPFWVFTAPLLLLFLTGAVSLYGLVTHPRFLLAAIMAGATVLLTLVIVIVQFVLHGRRGTTIGKSIFGLRSVHVATLECPGFWRVVLRSLVVAGSGIVVVGPLLMLLSPLWDPARRGRGWHDYVGSLWMIDIRRGLDPYDEKRMRIARKAAEAAEVSQRPDLPSLSTSSTDRPSAQYRPAARVSAGVLGVAQPNQSSEAARVGLPEPGTQPAQDPAAGAAPQVVLGVPGDLRGAPPERPAPRRPESPAEAVASDPAPTPAVPPRPPAPPACVLVVDTGQRIRVAGRVLVGRDPQPRDDVGDAQIVAIGDETRSISKTHLSFRVTERGVELADLASTNGTEIERDGVVREVAADTPVLAAVGDTVRFGERSLVIHSASTDRLA